MDIFILRAGGANIRQTGSFLICEIGPTAPAPTPQSAVEELYRSSRKSLLSFVGRSNSNVDYIGFTASVC